MLAWRFVLGMYATGFTLEEGYKKGPTRQQATPLWAPGESSWKQCLRRHLLDQRTHVIPGITSHMDAIRHGPCVSNHIWSQPVWQPRSDWPQICLADRMRRALTPSLFCWWWETESQSLTLQPWRLAADQNLCPPQSDASGVLVLCRWLPWVIRMNYRGNQNESLHREVSQVPLVWSCWLLWLWHWGSDPWDFLRWLWTEYEYTAFDF